MATMYSLFFGLLFTALCSDNGDGSGVLVFPVPSHPSSRLEHSGIEGSKNFTGLNYSSFLCRSVTAAGPVPFLSTEKGPNRPKGANGHPILFKLHKGQGLVARLNCLLISGNKTTEGWKPSSAKLNSLRSNRSDCLSEIIENSLRLAQPRPFFLGNASSTPLQSLNLSPANRACELTEGKFLTIAGGGSPFVSKIFSDEFLFPFCGKKEKPCHSLVPNFGSSSGIEAKHSGKEDNNSNKTLRQSIIAIASAELGTSEATGNNDGPRIEQYLRYTNLGKGYEWCSAFVSWCYGQAGFAVPRNPWSPALFPKVKLIRKDHCQPADVFGIYGVKVKRINHVGMIKERQNNYLISIEGNSNNRVESRRRHQSTIYAIADWVTINH